jgi:hypothetical protein
MKNILIALLGSVLFSNCGTAQNSQKPANPAEKVVESVKIPEPAATFVTWDKKSQDLGKVKKGESRKLAYEMQNSSGEPIQIDIVDACECTKVDFPRGLILAGEKRRFDVTFDSSEKETGETIGITIVFKNVDAKGNPRIESINYSFEIEK